MTADFLSSQSSQELRREIQSHIASPALLCPPTQPSQATARGPKRENCSLWNPGRKPRILDLGLHAWDSGPIPHPSKGPSLSPPSAFWGLPALCPAGHPWPVFPLPAFRGYCKRPSAPFLQPYIANPDSFTIQMGGGRVEDVGEAEALPNLR